MSARSRTRRRRAKTDPVEWRRLAPWAVIIVAGALLWAATGWLICAAVCLCGWLTDVAQPISAALSLASALFLLANGTDVVVAGVPVTLVPLLLTLAFVVIGIGILRFAVRHGFSAAPDNPVARLIGVALVTAVSYAAATMMLAGMTATGLSIKGPADSFVIGFVAAWWAAAPLCGWRIPWPSSTPAWVRALPRACGAGLGVLGAGGALLMIVALLFANARVTSLQTSLQPGAGGAVLLAVAQSLWSPTLILWGISWMVGAGVTLGVGTVVSPVAVELGVLPSIPVFGIVPANGMPPSAMLFWAVVPVFAGVVAAWVVVRAQATEDFVDERPPRIEVGALIGGASGIATSVVVTALAALSRGDLGLARLTGLGPQLSTMFLLTPVWLGIAGVLAGALITWRRASQYVGPPDVVMPSEAAAPAKPKPPPQPWLDDR